MKDSEDLTEKKPLDDSSLIDPDHRLQDHRRSRFSGNIQLPVMTSIDPAKLRPPYLSLLQDPSIKGIYTVTSQIPTPMAKLPNLPTIPLPLIDRVR